jgi:heme O synthase-like polyprenyltransferase
MKKPHKKASYQRLLYPICAYAVTIMLILALSLRPSWLFMGISLALGAILLLLSLHHYHERTVHRDTYIEYLLVVVAVTIILIGAIRHQ